MDQGGVADIVILHQSQEVENNEQNDMVIVDLSTETEEDEEEKDGKNNIVMLDQNIETQGEDEAGQNNVLILDQSIRNEEQEKEAQQKNVVIPNQSIQCEEQDKEVRRNNIVKHEHTPREEQEREAKHNNLALHDNTQNEEEEGRKSIAISAQSSQNVEEEEEEEEEEENGEVSSASENEEEEEEEKGVEEVVPSDRDSDVLFSVKELEGIQVMRRGKDFIEVECGCTSNRFGDSAGNLQIYTDGRLEISCDCYHGCPAEKISPSEFEKHALLKGASNWRTHVWVFVNGDKVPLKKTKLLKYHKGSASDPSLSLRPRRQRTVHRDELIECSKCGKERRFQQRTEAECKAYHKAVADNHNWCCSDYPFQVLRCEDEEERASKKLLRGCPQKPTCEGCTFCVCFGCPMCRFPDCSCRPCLDFTLNAEPGN